MITAGDLVSEASLKLHGGGSTQDRLTPLTSDIGAGDTQFIVDFTFGQAVGITPGIVEIDSEQLYVTAVDAVSGACTVANGFGRGYNGTTAATHSAGAKVVSRPKFTRFALFRQLNEILGAVYPQLFAVGRYVTTVSYPSNTYTIPAVAPIEILDAQWQDPIGDWQKCPSYTVDPYDATVRLGSGCMIGRPLRLLYATPPSLFTAETDLFSVTGLPASCQDMLVLGVLAKVVPDLDVSRAQLSSVEQSDRSRVVPPSAGVNAGKYLMAEFQERLQDEARSLRRQYKPRLVRTF